MKSHPSRSFRSLAFVSLSSLPVLTLALGAGGCSDPAADPVVFNPSGTWNVTGTASASFVRARYVDLSPATSKTLAPDALAPDFTAPPSGGGSAVEFYYDAENATVRTGTNPDSELKVGADRTIEIVKPGATTALGADCEYLKETVTQIVFNEAGNRMDYNFLTRYRIRRPGLIAIKPTAGPKSGSGDAGGAAASGDAGGVATSGDAGGVATSEEALLTASACEPYLTAIKTAIQSGATPSEPVFKAVVLQGGVDVSRFEKVRTLEVGFTFVGTKL